MAELFDVTKPSYELTRADLIQGLRELADFLEDNEHLIPDDQDRDHNSSVWDGRVTITQFIHEDSVYKRHDETDEQFEARRENDERKARQKVRDQIADLALRTDGSWQKDYSSHRLDLRRNFGYGSVRFELSANRDLVCTARKIGTKIEKVRDPDALANVPMIERVVDVLEYDCAPILSRADRDA